MLFTLFVFAGLVISATVALSLTSFEQLRPSEEEEEEEEEEGNKSSLLKLFKVVTFHARFHPVFHSFKYSLFFIGLDILKCPPSVACLKFDFLGILSLRVNDYLSSPEESMHKSQQSLAERLQYHLDKLGFKLQYSSAELITTPRFFGFAFNPLSMYFLRDDKHQLLAVLLEVNNTFKEKHVYLCHEGTKLPDVMKGGYDVSYSIPRAFHVSPFNNRTGRYEVSCCDDKDRLDVLLNMLDYVDDASLCLSKREEKIHMTARVHGSASYMNANLAVAYLLVYYPINCMLTVPRIMWQAFLLTYRRRLPVFQRPNPYTEGGNTIISKPASGTHLLCKNVVLDCLDDVLTNYNQSHNCKIAFKFIFPDGTVNIVEGVNEGLDSGEPNECKTIHVRGWNGFTWFLQKRSSLIYGFYLGFVKGDFNASYDSVEGLYQVLIPSEPRGKVNLRDSKNHIPLSIPISYQWSISVASVNLWFESFIFKNSAKFVAGGDVWNFPERCASYISQTGQSKRPLWDGLEDLKDSLSGLEKENIRSRFFLI